MQLADEQTSTVKYGAGNLLFTSLSKVCELIHPPNKVLVASQIFISSLDKQRASFLSNLIMTRLGMVPMESDCTRRDFYYVISTNKGKRKNPIKFQEGVTACS